jgi:hypothetical protein
LRSNSPAGLLLAAAFFNVGCGSSTVPQKPSASVPEQHVKILSFYPRDVEITEGEKTVLCYGVSDAKSLQIDPPVAGVSPALSRCVEVRPKSETRYTLTAVGSDGQAVSQSATIRIGIEQETLPKITSFQIDRQQKDYAGRTIFTLSFADRNAEEVSIDPPVFQTLHGAPSGQFSVRPDKTTTYTLTVKNKNGHLARRQLTVELPDVK